MAKSELLYTIPEGCREAGVGKSTMYRRWNDGTGPKVVRIGGRSFIAKDTLREWIRGLEVDAFPVKAAAVPDAAPKDPAQHQVSVATKQSEQAAHQPLRTAASVTTAPPARLKVHRPVAMQDFGGVRRRREPR